MFIRMLVVRHSLNFYGFGAHVPDAEPAQSMDVYLLMIDYNGFLVGGASWFRHREKFPRSSMTGFLGHDSSAIFEKRYCLIGTSIQNLIQLFWRSRGPNIGILNKITGGPRCLASRILSRSWLRT